jgi:hypothetical protein
MKTSEDFLAKHTHKRRMIDEGGPNLYTESFVHTYSKIIELEKELELLEKYDPNNKDIEKIKIKLEFLSKK